MSNIEILKQEIRDDEGWCDTTYPGPKTGLPHIGYGHLLGQEQTDEELAAMGLEDELDDWTDFTITKEQGEALLDIDVGDVVEGLHPSKRYPGWTEDELEALDSERFIALMSMAYQLGGPGVRMKFPSFVKAVKAEDWERAADEMLWSNGLRKERRSQWYKDTPKRCQEMADKMRLGGALNEIVDDDIPDLTEDVRSTERLLQELESITEELRRRIHENDL